MSRCSSVEEMGGTSCMVNRSVREHTWRCPASITSESMKCCLLATTTHATQNNHNKRASCTP